MQNKTFRINTALLLISILLAFAVLICFSFSFKKAVSAQSSPPEVKSVDFSNSNVSPSQYIEFDGNVPYDTFAAGDLYYTALALNEGISVYKNGTPAPRESYTRFYGEELKGCTAVSILEQTSRDFPLLAVLTSDGKGGGCLYFCYYDEFYFDGNGGRIIKIEAGDIAASLDPRYFYDIKRSTDGRLYYLAEKDGQKSIGTIPFAFDTVDRVLSFNPSLHKNLEVPQLPSEAGKTEIKNDSVLYISENKLMEYDMNTESESVFCNFEGVEGFSVASERIYVNDSQGNIYSGFFSSPDRLSLQNYAANTSGITVEHADAVSAYANSRILIFSKSQGMAVQAVKSTDTSLSLLPGTLLASYGAAPNRLNSPSDLALSSDGKYCFIADTGNNRVVRYAFGSPQNTDLSAPESTVSAPFESPEMLAVTENGNLFVKGADNNIYVSASTADNLSFRHVFTVQKDADKAITDMYTVGDELYIIESGTEYTRIHKGKYSSAAYLETSILTDGGGFVKNVMSAAVNVLGDRTYYLTKDGIYIFADTVLQSKIPFDGTVIDTENLIGIQVDFAGSVFVAESGPAPTIHKFLRTEEGYRYESVSKPYDPADTYTFDGISAFEISVAGTAFVLDGARHLIHSTVNASSADKKNLGIVSYLSDPVSDFPVANASDIKASGIYVAYIKKDTSVKYHPANAEITESLKKGSYFMVLSAFTTNKKYIYDNVEYVFGVSQSGFTGYVSADITDRLEVSNVPYLFPGAGEETYISSATADIYSMPYTVSGFLRDPNMRPVITETAEYGTRVKILSHLGLFDGYPVWQDGTVKWFYAEYETVDAKGNETIKRGYLRFADLAPKDYLTERSVYGKKVSLIAEEAGIYMFPDTASALIKKISKGAKLTLFENFDKSSVYTKIYYQGSSGYVLTSAVAPASLSAGTIAGIAVGSFAAFSLISGLIGFLYVYKLSKKARI